MAKDECECLCMWPCIGPEWPHHQWPYLWLAPAPPGELKKTNKKRWIELFSHKKAKKKKTQTKEVILYTNKLQKLLHFYWSKGISIPNKKMLTGWSDVANENLSVAQKELSRLPLVLLELINASKTHYFLSFGLNFSLVKRTIWTLQIRQTTGVEVHMYFSHSQFCVATGAQHSTGGAIPYVNNISFQRW